MNTQTPPYNESEINPAVLKALNRGPTSDPSQEPILFIGGCRDGKCESTPLKGQLIAIPPAPPGSRGNWKSTDHMQMYDRTIIAGTPVYKLVTITNQEAIQLLLKHYHPDPAL